MLCLYTVITLWSVFIQLGTAAPSQRWLTAPVKPLYIASMVPALFSLLFSVHCCLFSTVSCINNLILIKKQQKTTTLELWRSF